MAKIRVTFSQKQGLGKGEDIIGDRLRIQLQKFIDGEQRAGANQGVPLEGAAFGRPLNASAVYAHLILTTPLAYWWYQEFGVGKFFKAGAASSPLKRPTGVLEPMFGGLGNKPSFAKELPDDVSPDSKTARRLLRSKSNITTGRYLIASRRSRRLKFWKEGKFRYPQVAWHPGFEPWQLPEGGFGAGDSPWGRGMIRVAIWQFRKNVARRLLQLGKRAESMQQFKEGFDLRSEILAIFNDEMAKVVRKLQRGTPRSPNDPVADRSHMNKSEHLKEAWDFIPAR